MGTHPVHSDNNLEIPNKVSTTSGPFQNVACWLVFPVVLATFAHLYRSILVANRGIFTYTLDDPYISLAVGRQIWLGNYGVNALEHSSPSSSILFPFLLAPFSGFSFGVMIPLFLDLAGLLLTVFFLHRLFFHLRIYPASGFGIVSESVVLIATVICLNLIAVVFTGLEHSLHIAATAAAVLGVAKFVDTNKLPRWLPYVLVLLPLIRYEGLALSAGVLLVMLLRRKWLPAILSAMAIILSLGAFSLFLVSMKLPPMPNSIMVKSLLVAQGVSGKHESLLDTIGIHISSMRQTPMGSLLLAVLLLAVVAFLCELYHCKSALTPRASMALVLIAVLGGHAVAGGMGWLYRYEDYAMLSALMFIAYLAQEWIRSKMRAKERVVWVAAIAVLWPFVADYISSTRLVPIAANDIYMQQYQMRRFVQQYWRRPVAVNDIGLVTYGNSHYVLDMWGLASEQARAIWAVGANADAFQSLVEQRDVKLVIVYESWFENKIPNSWRKVATLKSLRTPVSAHQADVEFYATDAETLKELTGELQAFRPTLPQGTQLFIDLGASKVSDR
ncbi:MAG: hypothetical protein P4L03_08480 [Terracidiphilus sp.]|nr:hypothetical protein [Terracidiphilus sp.]